MPADFSLRPRNWRHYHHFSGTFVENIFREDQRGPRASLFMSRGLKMEIPHLSARRLRGNHFLSSPSDRVCSHS
jgi:hypothetical protein